MALSSLQTDKPGDWGPSLCQVCFFLGVLYSESSNMKAEIAGLHILITWLFSLCYFSEFDMYIFMYGYLYLRNKSQIIPIQPVKSLQETASIAHPSTQSLYLNHRGEWRYWPFRYQGSSLILPTPFASRQYWVSRLSLVGCWVCGQHVYPLAIGHRYPTYPSLLPNHFVGIYANLWGCNLSFVLFDIFLICWICWNEVQSWLSQWLTCLIFCE